MPGTSQSAKSPQRRYWKRLTAPVAHRVDESRPVVPPLSAEAEHLLDEGQGDPEPPHSCCYCCCCFCRRWVSFNDVYGSENGLALPLAAAAAAAVVVVVVVCLLRFWSASLSLEQPPGKMVLILVVAAVVVVDATNVSLMPNGSNEKVYSLLCVVGSLGGQIWCAQGLNTTAPRPRHAKTQMRQ